MKDAASRITMAERERMHSLYHVGGKDRSNNNRRNWLDW